MIHLLQAVKYLGLRNLKKGYDRKQIFDFREQSTDESRKKITPEQSKELEKLSKVTCRLEFLRDLTQVKRLVEDAEKGGKAVSFIFNGVNDEPVIKRPVDDDAWSIDSVEEE